MQKEILKLINAIKTSENVSTFSRDLNLDLT